MASTINPAARRVLSPLNVNTSSPRNVSILKGSVATSAEGLVKVVQSSITAEEKSIASIHQQAAIDRKSWSPDHTEGDERPAKRARTEPESIPSEEVPGVLDAENEGLVEGVAGREQTQASLRSPLAGLNVLYDARSQSASASPTSSFESGTAGLNDSQNTILTEPDEVSMRLSFSQPSVHHLTKEEARQKAEALRLRLRLASYRVFTNQITTPWKDLEVRTMPLGKLNPSQLSPAQSPNQNPEPRHDEVARRRSNEPIINPNIPSSPPAAYVLTRSASPDKGGSIVASTPTPLPPTQVESGIIPLALSFGMPNADDADVSNAVKRSIATDGLLSLMRQQDSAAA